MYHSCWYHVYYIQIIFGNRIIISLRPFIASSIVKKIKKVTSFIFLHLKRKGGKCNVARSSALR